MNLRDCKRLRIGDSFRRPSKNEHDNGWREYTVISVEGEGDPHSSAFKLLAFTVRDQHGYDTRFSLVIWNTSYGAKEWFKTAEPVR